MRRSKFTNKILTSLPKASQALVNKKLTRKVFAMKSTLKGTSKNTGLTLKQLLRLMSWPASALGSGRGKADFSRCP